ncbi:MAG: cation-translocating P-type ATPase [Brevinematales bacterium]|jgi:Ca2+-transporting ATPase
MEKVMELAGEGLRVLGVAHSEFHSDILPEIQHDFDFEFLGLIGLSDPVRPSVYPAVKECYRAGIRVMMITGDYPGTAVNIAKQIGLNGKSGLITGQEISAMGQEEFKTRLKNTGIFARMVPEQKLIIVNSMKDMGEVVAMTGDGVNDAPALKSSHIGIAMGLRGTDVAREAADLVLLDDDFSSIVSAVRMGRRIFDNLKKAMIYVISIHIPIAGMALIPVLFKFPLILLPVHIVFLEMIIDPACSIVFEAENEEEGIMDRPPRSLSTPLIGRDEFLFSVLQGFCVLLTSLAVYLLAGLRISDPRYARAAAFTTLIIANLGLILSGRSWKSNIFKTIKMKNTALWLVVSGSAALLALVLTIPALRDIFLFDALKWYDIIWCIGAGLANMMLFEIMKLIYVKRILRSLRLYGE